MREIDIVTAINSLRKNRLKFQIDTDSEAFEHSKRLVDRLWPLAAAQIKPGVLYLHLPKVDENAEDQEAEQRNRRNAAVIAKLCIPDRSLLHHDRSKPYDRNRAIDELDAELKGLAETGMYTRERELLADLAKLTGVPVEEPVSKETLRYNRSLSPGSRNALFGNGLHVPASSSLNKRRRKAKATSHASVPFVRGRKEWRPKQLLTACEHLRDVAAWIAENRHDSFIQVLENRYDFAGLKTSKSSVAPADYSVRLAVAIASADHCDNGTDCYVSNDALAISTSRIYGLYAMAVQRAGKSRAGKSAISDIFKSLI